MSPFARTNRLKEIKSKDIIKGNNPGPGFLRVPGFSIIPPTAKNTPTANQKRLPTTSDPSRFILISVRFNSYPFCLFLLRTRGNPIEMIRVAFDRDPRKSPRVVSIRIFGALSGVYRTFSRTEEVQGKSNDDYLVLTEGTLTLVCSVWSSA